MEDEQEVPPVTVTLRKTGSVRIVAAPAGEAPIEVRREWIGLVLPLAGDAVRDFATLGVVTGTTSRLGGLWRWMTGKTKRMRGYLVDSRAALMLLERSSPEAAQWWRANAPQFFEPRQNFVFDEACCERVDSGTHQGGR